MRECPVVTILITTGLFDKNQNLQGYHRELSADPAIQGGLRKKDLGQGFLIQLSHGRLGTFTSQGRAWSHTTHSLSVDFLRD